MPLKWPDFCRMYIPLDDASYFAHHALPRPFTEQKTQSQLFDLFC